MIKKKYKHTKLDRHLSREIKALKLKWIAAYIIFQGLQQKEVLSDQVTVEQFTSNIFITMSNLGSITSIELNCEALGIDPAYPWRDILLDKDKQSVKIPSGLLDSARGYIIGMYGTDLVNSWIDVASTIRDQAKTMTAEFDKILKETWGEALDILDIILSTSIYKGIEFLQHKRALNPPKRAASFEVVTHSYGRAHQVGREIHLLLSGGYADGAEARWRTLHELVVVTSFIVKKGEDTAKRYMDHEVIDTYKTLMTYETYHKPHGIDVVSEKELKAYKLKRDQLIAQYGNLFDLDYGWAAVALGATSRGQINMFEVEKAVGLEYLRPMFKEANSNVHASSRGTGIRLGLPKAGNEILAGNSLYGIGEVAQHTGFSVLVLEQLLLNIFPSISNEVHIDATYKLMDRLTEAVHKADEKIAESEKLAEIAEPT